MKNTKTLWFLDLLYDFETKTYVLSAHRSQCSDWSHLYLNMFRAAGWDKVALFTSGLNKWLQENKHLFSVYMDDGKIHKCKRLMMDLSMIGFYYDMEKRCHCVEALVMPTGFKGFLPVRLQVTQEIVDKILDRDR